MHCDSFQGFFFFLISELISTRFVFAVYSQHYWKLSAVDLITMPRLENSLVVSSINEALVVSLGFPRRQISESNWRICRRFVVSKSVSR